MFETVTEIYNTYADPREIAAWDMKQFAPPPNVKASEFVDGYRILTAESGAAEEGIYRISRTPHVAEPLDSFYLPDTYKTVIMANHQSGKTVGVLENIVFVDVHLFPCTIVHIGETKEKMQDYSKSTVDSMIEKNDGLRERFFQVKSRTSGNTLLHKKFAGGSYRLKGANTPTSFSQYTCKHILLDEVDRWQSDIGGDPIALAEGRISRVLDSKMLIMSTPTVAGASTIEREFALGTQSHYTVPCTHCGHYQVLVFGPRSQFYLPMTDLCNPPIIGGIARGYLEFDKQNCTWAAYHCEKCNKLIDDRDRARIMQAGKWRAFNPKPAYITGKGLTRSYHFSEMIFLIETSWLNLAQQFLDAQRNREKLRVWVNEKAGETFEDIETASITAESLGVLRSDYYSEKDGWQLPPEVVLLIASCDVQVNRIELLLVGYGMKDGHVDAWSIDHKIFEGSPEHATVWTLLDAYLQKEFAHPMGIKLPIVCTFIDSGAWQERVLQYTTPRQSQYIYGIKGFDKGPIVSDPMRVGKNQEYIQVHIGKDRANARLYQFLNSSIAKDREETDASKIHFNFTGTSQPDYFEQLTNMKSVKVLDRGMMRTKWMQKDRNVRLEVNHMWTYNLAALHFRRVDWAEVMKNFAAAVEESKQSKKPDDESSVKPYHKPDSRFRL